MTDSAVPGRFPPWPEDFTTQRCETFALWADCVGANRDKVAPLSERTNISLKMNPPNQEMSGLGSAPDPDPEVSFRRQAACRYRSGQTQDHPLTWNVFYEMNHREPPLSPADTHGTRLGLLLGLLLAGASTGSHAQIRLFSISVVMQTTEATPYLQATGAPPLRFQEAALPLHPAPAAPAPAATPAPTPTATTPAPTEETAPAAVAITDPATTAPSFPVPPANPETSTAPAKTPAPILPDDARPPIRAEDFLPYFQIPGSAKTPADVTLLVPVPKAPPAPGALPPSSATYTQSPK